MLQEKPMYHKIYVTFITTDTYLGKIIRFFTRNQYNHVTITFDQDLNKMYSFARYHINSPLYGGFVMEQPTRYLVGNQDVTIKVCEVPLTYEEYKRIQNELELFTEYKDVMIYNTLNALLSLLKLKLSIKNAYTCIEFATYLLNIQDVMTIKELEQRLKKYIIYQGSLRNIASSKQTIEDDFFCQRHFFEIITDTAKHFKKVINRAFGY